ncbi:MAG: ribosome biogenesis/translation initiation ATPase RLI [Candidatus Parvarchaeota archaeon]|nr:ribosome biogenesis/translation initiation ATPase RLI [Candidatus Parvarchaeota archaeon]MCW1301583.1 ribosome biogenesis/translation initiation ATPase RLI [Candidatus Parvarchaeota archaeon]
MKIVTIKEKECQAPQACDYICAQVCPRVREGAINTVYKRENKKAAIDEELCIACGICVNRCPYDAIRVINLPDELNRELTFQYGVNSFRTYNIISPMNGKVVGILGKNGIGKTTNINLISNSLKPNFGNFVDKTEDKEIIRRFRGREIQPYLERLYSGELKVSKKEQNLALTGAVKDAVKENKYNLISRDIMDRDISSLSGGQAQLVEISAALDKDADVYILDEPMNYLDISQRLKVAKTIKENLKDKTVVIVEHDLIMLDYLTDFVQIMYGSESNYGIVSHIMPTRQGINNYLRGYLPAENMRFRDHGLNIKGNVPEGSLEPLTSWPDFNVEVGGFKLFVKEGTIYKGEIIGIIGENGIGKTTFARAMTGAIDTDAGKLELGIRISYKPQFIEAPDVLVKDLLASIRADFTSNESFGNVMKKLEIDRVLSKNVKNLSGGELQKLAIFSTILRDADIYLFDEPSANLDLEDRLETINIIGSFIKANRKSAMIIDHDLTLINAVSTRALLFEGDPDKTGIATRISRTDEAINNLLKRANVTMRKDAESGRPRINLPGSRLDMEQKEAGKFFET